MANTRSRNRQLVFNYAKVSIDKIHQLPYAGPGLCLLPHGEETDELKARVRKAEQLLRQVYEQNNLQQLDWETEIDTAILGDGCYKVIWDTDEKRIRITAPDVSGIFAWWLGDDTSRVWRVASRYTLTQDESSSSILLRIKHHQEDRHHHRALDGQGLSALPG